MFDPQGAEIYGKVAQCNALAILLEDLILTVDTIVETEKELGPNSAPPEYIEEGERLGALIRHHVRQHSLEG